MIVPAGLYEIFNLGTSSANGWGIPIADDLGPVHLNIGHASKFQLSAFT
jgi:Na+/H+ antiporter NhaA